MPSALLTYEQQVAFAKMHIRRGTITQGGTWRRFRTWGKTWSGVVAGYHVSLETIGDGPLMRAGSFTIHFAGKAKT